MRLTNNVHKQIQTISDCVGGYQCSKAKAAKAKQAIASRRRRRRHRAIHIQLL